MNRQQLLLVWILGVGGFLLYWFVLRKRVRISKQTLQCFSPLDVRPSPQVLSWRGLIQKYASRFGIPGSVIASIIHAESGGNPNAENPHDPSYGLMQITPGTAQALGFTGSVSALKNPDLNILLGSKYLAALLSKHGDLAKAVAAYNAGDARIDNRGCFINQGYVDKVLSLYSQYRALA